MKKLILALAAVLLQAPAAPAGEISAGSVPGTLNYQGRLERDNAPITGPIHLYFRIYNSFTASGGNCETGTPPCLWESPELTVQAAQGIFSAELTPPLAKLGRGERLYLEVQVESDTLSPREPFNSVAYALVAKRLEDGADVTVSTLVATYNVSLATAQGATLTVGAAPAAGGARLTLDGWLKINSGGIIFPDNSSMNVASVASAGNIANDFDADILADRDNAGGAAGGDVVFRKPTREFMRITNSGKVGIGQTFTSEAFGNPPGGPMAAPLLDVDGPILVGGEGIYDRDDGEVNVKENLAVEGGRLTGMNAEYLSIGEADNVVAVFSDGGERLRVHSNGFVGVGTNSPAVRLHSSDNIAADSGVRGARVSVGAYAPWAGRQNEVKAETGYPLLLQDTNPYNVGVGTNTPREKLHVRGSVLSDYGLIASTGHFSGDVRVNGDLTVNSGQGNTVNLSSTVVYGTLLVTGGIGSQAGIPVYLKSTQTLTGQNTFLNQLAVSSDVYASGRVGAGVSDFDFPGSRYLQVGDSKPEFANDAALAYLVAGSNADSGLHFYRGASLAARLETQGASNLALVVGGQARTLTDATYHRIQNSVVWISTGYATTPAIFVSSFLGNVGVGTAVLDPNWRLTVNGNLRISGPTSNGIIFADGTTLNSAGSIGSATSISNNGDAVVQSNADLSGGGDVVLRAGSLDGLVLNTGGNVGIGTLSPVSRLNVRGGDLVLGTPFNPYGADSVSDLVVAGNIAFDGELLQRSNLPVNLSALVVASNVHLSTGPGARTGVGTRFPFTTFDVNGNAQFGSGAFKSTFTAAGALQLATQLTVPYGGTGATSLTAGGVLFGGGTGAITASPVLANGQLLIGNGTGAPTAGTLTQTANQVLVANGAGTITLSLPQDIHTGATPTFGGLTLTSLVSGGVLFGGAGGPLTASAVLTNGQLLIGDGAGAPAAGTLTGTSNQVNVANGAGSITLSLPQNIHAGAAPQFAGLTAAYVRPAADGAAAIQLQTLAGVNVLNVDTSNRFVGIRTAAPGAELEVNGKILTTSLQLTSGAQNNYVLTSDGSGNASWSNPASGSFGDGWVGNEVRDAANATLTRSGLGTTGSPYALALNLGNANTWTALQTFSGGLSGSLTGNVSGNAGSATALQTARTINGVSFDGTANITVADATKVPTTRTVNGYPLSANVALTASDLSLGGGVTANYVVVVDTFPYTCSEFRYTNGILTQVVGATCP